MSLNLLQTHVLNALKTIELEGIQLDHAWPAPAYQLTLERETYDPNRINGTLQLADGDVVQFTWQLAPAPRAVDGFFAVTQP